MYPNGYVNECCIIKNETIIRKNFERKVPGPPVIPAMTGFSFDCIEKNIPHKFYKNPPPGNLIPDGGFSFFIVKSD